MPLAFAWSMMGMVMAQFPLIANSGWMQAPGRDLTAVLEWLDPAGMPVAAREYPLGPPAYRASMWVAGDLMLIAGGAACRSMAKATKRNGLLR